MKIKKRLFAFIFSLIFLLNSTVSFADDIVGVDNSVKSYIIGVYQTGDILYEKNADNPYPIASMSKIMTYLLLMDDIKAKKFDYDTKVKVSDEAAALNAAGYSALGLKKGQTYDVKTLLEGLMVVSGNDCAMQLAQLSEKNEKAFAARMNDYAQKLGLSSQVFYNASGISTEDGKQNTSSAKDMFKLASIVIKKYPEVLKYAKIRHIDIKKYKIHKDSTIPLVGEIKGVDGLKTGTTDEAGYCVTSTCDMKYLDGKDDFRTIGVVMGADSEQTRILAMQDLIYYVSRFFDYEKISDKNEVFTTIKDNRVDTGKVNLYPEDDLVILRNKDKKIKEEIEYTNDYDDNIKSGEVLATAKVHYDDKEYDIKLISKDNHKPASFIKKSIRSFKDATDFLIECLIAH